MSFYFVLIFFPYFIFFLDVYVAITRLFPTSILRMILVDFTVCLNESLFSYGQIGIM